MKYIFRIYGKILAFLLTLTGFSCEFQGTEEYGIPTATFKAKGTVVSEANDLPIEGIRAVMKIKLNNDDMFQGIDTSFTDSKGNFNLTTSEYDHFTNILYLELYDVDGEINGEFIDMDIELDYSSEEFKDGDGNWFKGVADIDLGTVKMTSKEKE